MTNNTKTQPTMKYSRKALESKYSAGRSNLLGVVIFTVINMILVLVKSSSYFLFSASIPYYITLLAMITCGKYPADYYDEEFLEIGFLGNTFFAVVVAFAFILVALYLLCWLMSKKRVGWLIFALVMFSLDTVVMVFIGGISFEGILDIVFHIWVLYYLIAAIRANSKLKILSQNVPADTMFTDIHVDGHTVTVELQNYKTLDEFAVQENESIKASQDTQREVHSENQIDDSNV